MGKEIRISNRRAGFEYALVDKYVAGLVLTGTEIKSIRNGDANLADSYCVFVGGELFVKNMNISLYKDGTIYNHEPRRDRKLLLNSSELRKLSKGITGTGMTIVVTTLFINPRGLAKLEIALAKGKRQADKRDAIKDRDVRRDIARRGE